MRYNHKRVAAGLAASLLVLGAREVKAQEGEPAPTCPEDMGIEEPIGPCGRDGNGPDPVCEGVYAEDGSCITNPDEYWGTTPSTTTTIVVVVEAPQATPKKAQPSYTG